MARGSRRAALLVAALVNAAACSFFQTPCADDELVRVAVSASPETNAGHGVQVRVFLLKSDVAFTAADFEDLARGDVAAMKEDVVVTKEAVIIPGRRDTMFEFPRGKDAAVRSLAVFAALEPRDGTWRLTRKLAPPDPHLILSRPGRERADPD